MSKFKLYPEYEDSGVDWLGKVPEHWKIGRLKHLATIRNGRDHALVEAECGPYPVIGSGGQFSRATSYLYDGVSVLFGRKGTVDKPLYVKGRFWTVDTMFYSEINHSIADDKYLFYYALTIPFDYYATNTALPSMTQRELSNHAMNIPPKKEQAQVALFLDHETARIDELIAEQKRLIELLKEKRQTVISHAVTKGLDPNAPMKDSGIEWLGEVPEHWQLFPLKKTLEGCINGVWGDEPSSKRGIVVIRVADFDYDRGLVSLNNLTKRNISEHDYYSRGLRSGDLLIEKSGGGAKTLVGRVVFYDHDLIAVTSNFVARLRPGKSFLGKYLYYVFSDLYEKQVNHRSIKQTTGIQNLDTESYLGEHFYFPLYEEQKKIAEFLDNETRKIDALIQEAEKAIELMNERRSALISAAVTGKIDVRDWQPEKEQVEALAS